MPFSHDTQLRSLRIMYSAALVAHQACAEAVADDRLAGNFPAAHLLEKEARARAELERAREALQAAMAAIVAPAESAAK